MDIHLPSSKQPSIQTTIDTIPGDKSISHRAIIVGSLANNRSVFSNFLDAQDCMHTSAIFQSLGVPIVHSLINKTVDIRGVGLLGLQEPEDILNVGNSGTGIRLITGVLAAQPFDTQITGDESIQKRPMKRIIDPLTQMGASISGQTLQGKSDIYPALTIKGNPHLSGIQYTMPVASAQVKSAILFASLYADSTTTISEPQKCRDHTERLLQGFGANLQVQGKKITCQGQTLLENPDPYSVIHIPSDFSSAAFFIVLGCLLPHTQLTLTGIGLNPTRIALLHVLLDMGAAIKIKNQKGQDMEPYGDIEIKTSTLKNIEVPTQLIPFLIDEIPILAVAALFAKGTLKITQAAELRTKESDRIAAIAAMVSAMGGEINEYEDGFEIKGPIQFKDFKLNSGGDHRMAMSGIIGAIASGKEAQIINCDCIDTSFPNFLDILKELKVSFTPE